MELTYLGQAGFLLSYKMEKYLVDPYLSNYVVSSGIGDARYFSREFPAPVSAHELNDISAIFVTHDHADHCDPDTILPVLANNSDCVVIGPQPALDLLIQKGVADAKLWRSPLLEWKELGSIRFTSLPSAHYELGQKEGSGNYPYRGFVFEIEGKTYYHSGDTILYEGLVDKLLSLSNCYDVCCLPVNGRDKERETMGITGNLQPEEALWLTDQLHAGMLIPMHNDLFKVNHLDPSKLDDFKKKHYPDLNVRWLKPGEVLAI